MWKQMLDFGQRLLALNCKTEQHGEDIKEIRQELRIMAEALQQVRVEQQRERENAASERKILLLEVQNVFLRFERRLPPVILKRTNHKHVAR